MPIRTATVNRQLEKNGARLHQAMMARIQTHGEDHEPSDAERALTAEREELKQERARRHELAQQPKQKASKLVRTHHPEARHTDAAPKVKKEKVAKPQGKGAKPTRAEKQATKAAALAAAKQKTRKPAAGKDK